MKSSFLIIAFISLTLSGCGSYKESQPENIMPSMQKNEIEKKQIVTSFYPLEFMTEQIVGDAGTVINITKSVDVHEYEPSPQDMVKLNEADLVVFQGAELEPWADGVIPELQEKGVMILEVSHDLALVKLEEPEDDHHEHEKDEYKEGQGTDEKDHEEHHHGEFDPHTWLDPVLASAMVEEILEAVIKIDPENKTMYENNAQKLKDRFAQLHQDFQTGLSQCSRKEVIVSHDSYGYLADRYGFEIHPIAGISTQDEPSAKILTILKKEAEEGITHILVEENKIRRFADTLAEETGLETLFVNPLERGTLDPQKDFFDVMKENLNSLKIALDCSR